MKRIYNDAEDKNVAVRIVYANESNAIFYDAELTEAVDADDAFNLFAKGVVAKKGTSFYTAKSCTDAGVIDFGFPVG